MAQPRPPAPFNQLPLDPAGWFSPSWVQFFQRLSGPPALVQGPTSTRPTTAVVGQGYFDTTLGVPIWWNGTIWVNAAGAAV